MKQLNLSDAFIERVLSPFGVIPDHNLCEAIRVYTSTLLHWNSRIALTTVTDREEILRVHFGESFFAASTAGIAAGRVADIGTGAGFPGIPIRMVHPSVELVLVDAVAKKTAFLHEVVRRLGMSGVDIIRCRMEDMGGDAAGFDFVTARALGKYDELLLWSKSRLSQNGKIVLLIGEAELRNILTSRGWYWDKNVIVPGSTGRFLLVGSPSPRL
jgi:16S rRNA (guanine527-N7)-methyltransferase